ncbi:MAG: dihydrolipoyl dehydrogenase [Planctomycetota bacterium]
MHSQVVVLGGGPGGYAAAFLAADAGFDVAIVDQESRLGGTCLLRGCIPSKALLHATQLASEATDELGEWGFEFKSPEIDVDTLRSRKEKVLKNLTGGLAQIAKKRKVRHIVARGTFASSTSLKLTGGDESTYDDDTLEYDRCILAAGSVPTVPKPWQVDSPRVMDSSGALDLADIPETLLVIGGGYIGLEMGTVYARLGSKVTVIELLAGLLPGADRDLVKPLHRRLGKQFEEIRLETKVTSIEPGEKDVTVGWENADGSGEDVFSRVLISVGRTPNTANLGLDNTKVQLDDGGFVQADHFQRTDDDAILAIGDLAGEPMLAHKASAEAKIAVASLQDHDEPFEPRAIPAVVFTDPEIAWAGLTETQAADEGIDVETASYPWAASGRAQALGRTEGLTKILFEPDSDRVLGVGLVGAGAGELISEAALAMEMGAVAHDIAETIHPHPTLSETITFAAELHLGSAVELYKPKKK